METSDTATRSKSTKSEKWKEVAQTKLCLPKLNSNAIYMKMFLRELKEKNRPTKL